MPQKASARSLNLKEVLAVIVIVVTLASILVSAVEKSNPLAKPTCLSNMMQIGRAAQLFAMDHDGNFPRGTYPGPRNWEVNPDVNPYNGGSCLDYYGIMKGYVPPLGGPPFTGCAYGVEFYRALMQVQLYPYLKDLKAWYCPQDKYNLPTAINMAQGVQSYHWFPNWVYNSFCSGPGPFPCVLYPSSEVIDLSGSPPNRYVDHQADRILIGELGMFGWDGPDAPSRNVHYHHPEGYNVIYFDGHIGSVPFGNKWRTIPASGWSPDRAPKATVVVKVERLTRVQNDPRASLYMTGRVINISTQTLPNFRATFVGLANRRLPDYVSYTDFPAYFLPYRDLPSGQAETFSYSFSPYIPNPTFKDATWMNFIWGGSGPLGTGGASCLTIFPVPRFPWE